MFLMHATHNAESVRPLDNDQRRAVWAARFYSSGHHRTPPKPRIKVTVPEPLLSKESK